MASVNWVKMKTTQQVKAVLRHDCKDTREAAQTHTNEDLDKTLTGKNYGFNDSYAEARDTFEKRLEAVTAGKTVRKDAVVGVGFSIPAPEGLPEAKEKEWFGRVYEILGETYGKENICCFAVHADERHEYIDPDTKESKMSRSHAQGIMVPEEDGRLCAKKFVSRARMISINNAIDKMSQEEFGVKFMDGSQAKSRGSVETMKQRSAQEQIDRDLEAARQKVKDVEQEATDKAAELAAREADVTTREADVTTREADVTAREVEVTKKESKLLLRESRAKRKEKEQQDKEAEFQRREDALEAQRLALQGREQALDAREQVLIQREAQSREAIRRGRAAMAEDQEPSETETQRPERRLPDIDF